MLPPMRKVKVPLGSRSYEIHIAGGLLAGIGKACARLGLGKRCAIVTDDQVAPLYANKIEQSLQAAGFDTFTFAVPHGEPSKRLEMAQRGYDALAAHRLERGSFILALGGGVVGDLAGFLAATYLRGIAFVQVPTTLLAQVDSSVGGKVGINLKAGKNLVGAFHQPRAVFCDLDTLDTLSEREFRAGMAEVIKYGIIYDARLFARLERELPQLMRREAKPLGAVIARCCEIKAEVVGQDETESGLRAILNFGHTIGHAIEATAGYGKFLHGEAISIGQVAAAQLSVALTGLSQAEAARIEGLLVKTGLPTQLKVDARRRQRMLDAMKLDKKSSGGEVKFVLAQKIGAVLFGQKVPTALISQAISPK